MWRICRPETSVRNYRGADKSLARPGRIKARKHVRRRARFQQHGDASCHQVFFFLQGKAPKEIHAILTETLACFLPGRAKDLSAPLYHSELRKFAKGRRFHLHLGGIVTSRVNSCANTSLRDINPNSPSQTKKTWFEASAAKLLKLRYSVGYYAASSGMSYRPFGTAYRPHPRGSTRKISWFLNYEDGTDTLPWHSLRNTPQGRKFDMGHPFVL